MADVPAIRITAIDDASKVIDQVGKSLGGLAASVVSIGAVMANFRAALDFGDQLQTTGERLGIAVDKLQELSAIAVQSGTTLESFGKAFKGLTQSMVAAQNSTAEQSRIFKALGVSIKDAQGNLRAVGDVAADAADALNSVNNETTRTAAGIVLFGKGYLEVAAALRTYRTAQAEAREVMAQFGTVSKDAAAAADAFGDRLKLVGEGFKAATLNELTTGFKSMELAIRDLQPEIANFARGFGALMDWVLEKAVPAFVKLAWGIERVGILLGGFAAWVATGNNDVAKWMEQDLKQLDARTDALLAKLERIRKGEPEPRGENANLETLARNFREQEVNAKALADALNTQLTEVAKKAASAVADFQKQAIAAQASLDQMLTLRGDKEPEAITKFKQWMVDPAWETFSTKQREQIKLSADHAAAIEKEGAATKRLLEDVKTEIENDEKAAEAKQKLIDERVKVVGSFEEGNDRLRQENDLIGANALQRELLVAKIEFETAAKRLAGAENGIAIDKLKEEYEQRKKLIEEGFFKREQYQQSVQLWTNIENAARDAFMHIFESGKSVFERLRDSLKNTLLALLYEMTVKRWVITVAASLTGGNAMANTVEGAVGKSAGGSLFGPSGIMGMLSGWADSSGLTAWAGNTALSLGFSGETASMIAANAIPIIGTIIGVGGSLIYNWLKGKEGGPKTGGQGTSGTAGARGGYIDSTGRWVTPSDSDSQMQQYTDAILKSYNEYAKAWGFKSTAGFSQAFTSDPKGTAGNILHTQAWVNGKSVYEAALGDLGRDTKELADRMALENKRALIAALKASDLPGILSKLFENIVPETITQEAADKLLTFSLAYKELYDVFNANPLDDALNAIAEAARGAQGALEKEGAALQDLIDNYDGSAEATVALSQATQQYYNDLVKILAQIEMLRVQISDMFAESIKTYSFAGMDKGGQYTWLADQVRALTDQLKGTTDITQVDRLTKLIDQYQREAFGLLTPEQQRQLGPGFIKSATDVNNIAAEQLKKAGDAAQTAADKLFTAIKTAIDGAAEALSGSANDLSNSADDLSESVGAPAHARTVTG